MTNEQVRGLTFAHLRWAASTFHLGVYQPLAWIALQLQYSFGGMSPSVYHGTSIALHILNTFILFSLIMALRTHADVERSRHDRRRLWLAGFVSLIFGLHPLRVEVVSWASSQPYLLCSVFYAAAMLAYVVSTTQRRDVRLRWLALTFFLATAAMFSKAAAVSLPVALAPCSTFIRCIGRPRSSNGSSDVFGWTNYR